MSFYVQQHNEVMPHSAFNGATPDEVYFERNGESQPNSRPEEPRPRGCALRRTEEHPAWSVPRRHLSRMRNREFYLPNPAQRSSVQLHRVKSQMSCSTADVGALGPTPYPLVIDSVVRPGARAGGRVDGY